MKLRSYSADRIEFDGQRRILAVSEDVVTVTLVGRTGSDKSTLARLMAGLYEPSAGRILFDGKNLTTLDLRSVRSQLRIVTQDAQLFGGAVPQNIALADPQMGLDQVS